MNRAFLLYRHTIRTNECHDQRNMSRHNDAAAFDTCILLDSTPKAQMVAAQTKKYVILVSTGSQEGRWIVGARSRAAIHPNHGPSTHISSLIHEIEHSI